MSRWNFGPPAKDFRWCCKVYKLGPLTEMIERNFPGGTITIEGNRALESFARADIGFVESNPFVPNQTILNPIRGWRAIEVWGYVWWKNLTITRSMRRTSSALAATFAPQRCNLSLRASKDHTPSFLRSVDGIIARMGGRE